MPKPTRPYSPTARKAAELLGLMIRAGTGGTGRGVSPAAVTGGKGGHDRIPWCRF